MDNDFNIDASLFMQVRAAIGSDETRYYLHGVLIEPAEEGGAWIVATDGRALLSAYDATAKVPRKSVVSLGLIEKGDDACNEFCDDDCCGHHERSYDLARLIFSVDPGKTAVAGFVQKHQSQPYELAVVSDLDCGDKYPNWRRVFAGGKSYEPRKDHDAYGFDADLLTRVTGGRKISLISTGDGQAFQILFSGDVPLTGLIMPVDINTSQKSRDLLAQITESAKAEVR